MAGPKESFDRDGYVVLPDMLPAADCRRFVAHLFSLKDTGRMTRDEQCPRSLSIYGDAALDQVLAELTARLSDRLGRELLPTYSYAHLYFPGEVLKRHQDRPACEISATMTLGYEGDAVWPIYFARDKHDFAGKKLELGVGTLAAYKGCELPHWRLRFEGIWQAQVFLHYVDAAGPYAAEYLDRRAALGAAKEGPNPHGR